MTEPNKEIKQENKRSNAARGVKFSIYGDDFDGRYMRISELRDLIPQFKDFYYEKKKDNPNIPAIKIILMFNELIAPKRFYPWANQYRVWRKKWDADIARMTLGAELALEKPKVRAINKTRDENNNLIIVPTESELEAGAKTLGGELMNDAMRMLRQDQISGEDLYEDEILIKRRHYVLNVFNYVMRAVNAKEALNIKKNQEKRETASFLMDLIRKSTAGRVTPEEMNLLKSSITPTQQNVESQPIH
jgi:hypothetical protein